MPRGIYRLLGSVINRFRMPARVFVSIYSIIEGLWGRLWVCRIGGKHQDDINTYFHLTDTAPQVKQLMAKHAATQTQPYPPSGGTSSCSLASHVTVAGGSTV
jgi:hypothetical protein